MDISLTQAINGFKLHNEAEGLSPKTIDWHNRNLTYFKNWLFGHSGKETLISEITAVQIRTYLNELRTDNHSYENHPYRKKQDKKVSPRTVQAYYTSLSSFFNWTIREEILTSSPVKNIPRPKVPKYLPDPFSDEEIRHLVNAAKHYSEKKSFRIMAMVLALLDTGLRMAELLSIQMEAVNLEQGRFRVMGKGAKERFVFLGKASKRAVWRYISFARPEPLPNVNNLFLTQEGQPITSRRFAHMLEDLASRAGVDKVHPHRFRRTAAIKFLQNGGDLFALQKMLGHETLEMVRRYVDLSSEDVEKAHQKASPVDNMKL